MQGIEGLGKLKVVFSHLQMMIVTWIRKRLCLKYEGSQGKRLYIDVWEAEELPKSFAEACIGLLKGKGNDFSTRIGKAARPLVARSYDRSVIVQEIR